MGERPSPDGPHPGKRRPPRAPSCRRNSAQSQLARARAVGSVTGPHARSPRTHSQLVVGPGRTPKMTSGRGWESARPRTPRTKARGALRRTASGKQAPAARPKGREVGGGRVPDPGRPTPRQEAPPPGALVPPPQRAKPARKSVCCGVGDGSSRPRPPHRQPVGSGPRPHARKDELSGVGERPTPGASHQGERRNAQSQLPRARAVGLVTGPHARTPHTHSQWVVGPGRTPQRTGGRGWESAQPWMPHT